MNIEEKIKKMESKRGKNHDLLEFRQWLTSAMPDHIQLPKVQIGGTNGKGSTVAWMNQLLTKSGYRVGVFTSPHLIDHRERIQIGEEKISAADWERIYDQYIDFFEEHDFTMFEMDLWMAVAYFLEQKVDIALMEVGMGGRLDATTALDYSLLLITNVGMDHCQYLGDSIEQIAFEKSGIFKPGVIALTTETKPNARKVMEQVAGYMKTMLGFVEMPYQEKEGKLTFEWQDHTYTMQPPKYQLYNLALALEGLHQLGYPLKPEDVQYVIDHFHWPGRFTVIRKDPLILIDGAHNADGIHALVKSIGSFQGHIYFSALQDKNIEAMLQDLKTLHCPITLVTMHNERAVIWQSDRYPIIDEKQLFVTLNKAKEDSLLCGSLYFIGDVLKSYME